MTYHQPFSVQAGGFIGIAYRRPVPLLKPSSLNGYREPRPDTLSEWQQIPWSGIEYNIGEARLLLETLANFRMSRLASVHQTDKKSRPFSKRQHPFPTHRFGHSIDVAACQTLLMSKHLSIFTAQELRSGVIAALLHDVLTAAGGDKTKIQNQRLFDEDAGFGVLLNKPEWRHAAQHFDLDSSFVHQVILETNIAGALKDAADKICYTARDSHALLCALKAASLAEYGPYQRIIDLIGAYPDICGLWQDIRVEGGQMTFSCPYRLARFLRLRALMFELVYHSTRTRRAAYVFDEVITRYFFDDGHLTHQDLLSMTDDDLDIMVDNHIQFEPEQPDPRWRQFKTRGEAKRFEQQLILRGVSFSVVEDLSHAPKPATHFLAHTASGPKPLRQVLSHEAAKIEEICRRSRVIRVGWLENPRCVLKPGLREQLQRYRLKRHKIAS